MERTCSLFILVLLICVTGAHRVKPCEQGYVRANDENECKNEEFRDSCGKNAMCVNTNGSFHCQCEEGYKSKSPTFLASSSETCLAINECVQDTNTNICGPNANCQQEKRRYMCFCDPGFVLSNGKEVFHKEDNVSCIDRNECEEEGICGKNATCKNENGSYSCVCDQGFVPSLFKKCEDICVINNTICGNGTCHHGAGGHNCACHLGFSNYGDVQARCTELKCEVFEDMTSLKENFGSAYKLVVKLKEKCKEISESEVALVLDEKDMIEELLSVIDQLLSGKPFRNNSKVSTFLDTVESFLRLIGPFNTPPGLKKSSSYTDLELHLHKGSILPQGRVTLSVQQAKLDIQMETVAGEPSQYPGFAAVSLISYRKLNESAHGFFEGVNKQDRKTIGLNSNIVTVTVSNPDTSSLNKPVLITLNHLQQLNKKSHCVYWDSSMNGGAWSTHGCKVKESNPNYTVCECDHLSSFAILMALYEVEDRFELQLITWIGLSLSLVCLFICILTFGLIRSIQSQRTKIHLHLSISLFLAFAIFLIGISRTENRVGCAVVAGLLHFFFLASFCWMCLEGIQLFRMVVMVFNTSFRTVYLMAAGYGVPAVIVSISALANAKGYGTERYCWLNLDSIWSFFAPVCIIIFVNIIFFLVTVWKLAQKFSSLNPDLDNLQKIKTFTITAVAQLCILGIMWIFGCFQFEKRTIAMSYLFTIFASLQGVLLFIMHCLCSKQVREEYKNILARCCAPQKKAYSEFGYTNTNKVQGTKSTQDTGESNM
ncbi:adhesion G protein-coupled receptor E1 isoform X2 [Periophthalmus magnuspinnatus]|uniref:adhesion G protein-coupled receptor E1 isoform X2 n=1 Tax=Periophthalmus magnuspinnatus TaxID=409849 RepID=UPI002436794F|nr:adhesion G protein-coupled receptor E1 isoform X2 [Periophthalmus magnuspinnatus]